MVMSLAQRGSSRAMGASSGRGPAAMASGELAKASLTNLDDAPRERIEIMFNPSQYSISKSNSWEEVKITGSNVPRLEFTSGGSTVLTLNDLIFDTYEDDNDVRRKHTNKFLALTRISPKTVDKKTGIGRPPRVLFSWGKDVKFESVVTSLSIDFTLFNSDGVPVRAKMSITLQECKDAGVKPAQNPTSQGTMGQKVYIVKPGDTLDRIAYVELGDSGLWREIANNNKLDNPMNLRPGLPLAIPSTLP